MDPPKGHSGDILELRLGSWVRVHAKIAQDIFLYHDPEGAL